MRISDWSSDVCSSDQLIAWDPVKQKPVWTQDYVTVWNGGTLATAGGLVFQGTADGRFVAYAADTGKRSEEHTSELQSLMRISYAVFCLTKKKKCKHNSIKNTQKNTHANDRT